MNLADPIVRHFRQILMWPLQLLGDEVGGADSPWAFLETPGEGNPWRELADEFTVDPDQFQERHYREFVTFLPHVQRFLYGHGRPIAGATGHNESPIRVFRRHDIAACRMQTQNGEMVDFRAQHVDLYCFFDIDIVILVVEIAADELPLSQIQDVLYRFGRSSPAGWDSTGSASSCLPYCAWIGHEGQVLAVSDMNERAEFLRFTGAHRAQKVAWHWQFLLQPMVLHHSVDVGAVRYRQIEYHRIPKLSYLALDDPFVLSDEAFIGLTMGTRSDGLPLPYSPATLQECREEMFYDRFWNPALGDLRASMRVTCNGHAMVMVGSAKDPYFSDSESGTLGQFRHQYFLLGLIAHFHKAALLSLSDHLVNAVSLLDLDDPGSERRFRDTIRSTREVFLRFNHRYWFHEVSNQSMAKDLFEMWSRHLGNDRLFQELREEVLDMGHYLDSDDARKQGDAVLRLTVVTILGLIGTIATGFLGMNLIDEADNPLPTKLLYFAMVMIPTVLLTLLTVRYSRMIADLIDTLADDSHVGLHSRVRALKQVFRSRRKDLRTPRREY